MSLFSPFISVISSIIRTVKGTGGSFTSLLIDLSGAIPQIIRSVTQIINMKKSEGSFSSEETQILIDDLLIEFDNQTGIEGISFFHSKTLSEKEAEEIALDHFKEFLRFTLYRVYGVKVMPHV